MKQLIKVTNVSALDAFRLRVTFSNGTAGYFDCNAMLTAGGSIVIPLRDPKMFGRVFLQMGVPTWPNGFDIDAMKLHDDMNAAGLLEPVSPQAAAE